MEPSMGSQIGTLERETAGHGAMKGKMGETGGRLELRGRQEGKTERQLGKKDKKHEKIFNKATKNNAYIYLNYTCIMTYDI